METQEASYNCWIGLTNRSTNTYPYGSHKNNLPSWLCSYISEYSDFWMKNLKNNYSTIDNELWRSEEFKECKYGSLEIFKNSIWNVDRITDVSNNKYMTVIKIDNSNYKKIVQTDGYKATFCFMIIFGVIFVIAIILIRIEKILSDIEEQ